MIDTFKTLLLLICFITLSSTVVPILQAQELDGPLEGAKHGFAKSGDVKIHYVTMGEGPLVVMIHGFPDYWYTWREQMPSLVTKFQVVAIDQRGYNKSDQPEGVENYKMEKLVGDIKAVVEHFGQKEAVIVGHDWGGMVSWSFAMAHPDMTKKLVILNLPHPNGLRRELTNNKEQQKNSQYARNFQKEGAEKFLTAKNLSAWVTDRDARKHYQAAFERSSFAGMLNYYRANYPKLPSKNETEGQAKQPKMPNIKCPVLMFHGLKDKALLPAALNDTWEWIDNELTLITIPKADHFVQQDAAEKVTRAMMQWLDE